MKYIFVLFLLSSFTFANSFESSKKELLTQVKFFKNDINPYVGEELRSILNELEKDIKKEKKQHNLDLMTLIFLDFKYQLINDI